MKNLPALMLGTILACWTADPCPGLETYSNQITMAECDAGAELSLWALRACSERHHAAYGQGRRFLPTQTSQFDILDGLKRRVCWMIPRFVDSRHAGNGDFLSWFTTPTSHDVHGLPVYPSDFPRWSVGALLAHVGAPSNYLFYTPWRPLSPAGMTTPAGDILPGRTAADYGWQYMGAILSNLQWTALTELCVHEITTTTTKAGGRRSLWSERCQCSTYKYKEEYGSLVVTPDEGEPIVYDRYETTITTNEYACSFFAETYKHLYRDTLHTSSTVVKPVGEEEYNEKTWDACWGRDRVISTKGIISHCVSLPRPADALVYLIRKGGVESLTAQATASVRGNSSSDKGCDNSDTQTSGTTYWDTADGGPRCELVGVKSMDAGPAQCLSVAVIMNPPSLSDLVCYTQHAEASVDSGACASGNWTIYKSESRSVTLTTGHYSVTGIPAILLKHKFEY